MNNIPLAGRSKNAKHFSGGGECLKFAERALFMAREVPSARMHRHHAPPGRESYLHLAWVGGRKAKGPVDVSPPGNEFAEQIRVGVNARIFMAQEVPPAPESPLTDSHTPHRIAPALARAVQQNKSPQSPRQSRAA